jgi:hypothetical protein
MAGEFDADPNYQVLHQVFHQARQPKRRSARSIAKSLRAANTDDGPAPRRKTPNTARKNLTEHQLECLDALDNRDTAYLRKLLDAFSILKKGESLEQRFTTFELAGLGIIYLREICGQKPVCINDLHEEVVKWQRDNQQRKSWSTRQWERAIARPELRPWLPLVAKSPAPRKS